MDSHSSSNEAGLVEEVSTPLEISQTLDSDKTLPKTLLTFLSKTRPEVKNVDFFSCPAGHYVAVVDAILNIDLRHTNMTANELFIMS